MERRDSLHGVAKTALGVAMVRARESTREDRLFNDPYAQRFLDAAPGAFPEEPTSVEERVALGPLASLGAAFAFDGVLRTGSSMTTCSPRPQRAAHRLCCSQRGSIHAPSGCRGRALCECSSSISPTSSPSRNECWPAE